MLDLYSSLDCHFIHVDVGFLPSNAEWNSTTVDIGLFTMQDGPVSIDAAAATTASTASPSTESPLSSSAASSSRYNQPFFVEGCRQYEDDFHKFFISEDNTWEVARIMTVVSGVAGIVAMVSVNTFSLLLSCLVSVGNEFIY